MEDYEIPKSAVLGLALRAALYDSESERNGRTIAYFFDTDVIASCLFARPEMGDNDVESTLDSRSNVRSLWLQHLLPMSRLTVSHQEELSGVLEKIERQGGIRSYWKARKEIISNTFGLVSKKGFHLQQLLVDLTTGKVTQESTVTRIVEALGLNDCSVIEGELAAQAYYRKGLLANRLDLDGDPGEELETIVRLDRRFQAVMDYLNKERPERQDQNKADAASLLAISRLWVRDEPHKIDYRFYTHTQTLREYCDYNPIGRRIGTKFGQRLDNGEHCTDSPKSFLRSSAYFIVRATFDSVGFPLRKDDSDLVQERRLLREVSDQLLQFRQRDSNDEFIYLEPNYSLHWSVLNFQHQTFAKRLLIKRRSYLLESLKELRKVDGISEFEDRMVTLEREILERIELELRQVRRRIKISLSARALFRRLQEVNIPSEKERAESIGRWESLFVNTKSQSAAVEELKLICGANIQELESRLKIADNILKAKPDVEVALAVIIPLLTVGEIGIPLVYLNDYSLTDDRESRLRFFAVRIWSLTLASETGRQDSKLLFDKFRDLLERLNSDSNSKLSQDGRLLMGAWVAAYLASALTVPSTGVESGKEVQEIAAEGLQWINTYLRSVGSSRPLDMAKAARWLLLGSQVLSLSLDPEDLMREFEIGRTLLDDARARVYLASAQRWAQFVFWRGESRHQSMRLDNLDTSNLAFEPFQVKCRSQIHKAEQND